MKDDMEDIVEEHAGRRVLCPRCGKAHFSQYQIIDAYIDCECGMRFYAFADTGLQITMPSSEAGYEPIARAMRRFVVATGRCTDIPPEFYQDENGQYYFGNYRETDVEDELERVLVQFQTEFFGECFLTNEQIYSICESFQDGIDVELRKQKKGIDIIKLIRKKYSSKKTPLSQSQKPVKRKLALDCAFQLMFPENGIMMNYQADDQRPQITH